MVGASSRRKAVRQIQNLFSVSERRACKGLGIARSVARYKPQRDEQNLLRQRIKELSQARVRYGYRRIHILLKREGIHVNHKRVYRLYCEEGLQIKRKRPRRHVSAEHRLQIAKRPVQINESWAMDFVMDHLVNGQRFRILTVVDTFTRECLATTAGIQMKGYDVIKTLDHIIKKRGKPKRIHCDNGSEFTCRITDLWAYQNKVSLVFSRPGKPTDNAFIESFNGSLRDECLNTHWFDSLNDAKVKLEHWKTDYNESRPHRALSNRSPLEFVAELKLETARVA